jgi:hypothetical protein
MNFFSKNTIESTEEFISNVGTKQIKHIKFKSLYHHLVRVKSMVQAWGLDNNTIIAALCHSLYSTEFFKEAVLNINSREGLVKQIGKEAEQIVYYFAIIRRETIAYDKESNTFYFQSLQNEKINISYELGYSLIHIMLANDIDHIDIQNIGYRLNLFDKYANVYMYFCEAAKKDLFLIRNEDYLKNVHKKSDGVFVRFIAHSGVQIADASSSLVVDPWLYPSTHENSIIEGFDPAQKTIDYLIPEPKNVPSDLAPDVICLSHFHTHHSPLKEIVEFLKIKPLTIVCPTLDTQKLSAIRSKIGDYIYERITFIFIDKQQVLTVCNFKIEVFPHQRHFPHLMYHITLKETSIFHVVDARVNQENEITKFSDSWEFCKDIRPDFLFVGAAAHLLKVVEENGVRNIIESSSLTPVQAAKLCVMMKAKNVGIIGIYNHSIWDDRVEMGLSVGEAEGQFYWAMSFLAPSISVHQLRPGQLFHFK